MDQNILSTRTKNNNNWGWVIFINPEKAPGGAIIT